MKTVLFMHGGSGNHGCEAIVRCTSKIIKEYVPSAELCLWSTGKDEDLKYGVDKVVDKVLATAEMNHKSLPFVLSYIKEIYFKKDQAMYQLFLKKLFKNSVAISIGGDNYCYPWSAKQGVELDSVARKYCKKTVFWGCSIDEESITKEVEEDLKKFDLITAREQLSYEILKKINPNTVKVADPAFLLDKKELPLPQGFLENNTVGINISPLINDYQNGENSIFENYKTLINGIINNTDMNVCLIPHVVWPYNDDLKAIDGLYEEFKNSDRVIKLGDYSCEELKGFISRCRFYIGARTHSTIAAYSTCVPTLVVGYSIKSKGIAMDLFGEHEKYVVPVQNLKSANDLLNAFEYFIKNEKSIKEKLEKVIPIYKKSALSAGEAISKLY